eukprot:scaffold110430_cov18-Tisochrysis_lutea.AAC.1
MLPHWLEALLNHSSVLAFLRDHNLCKDPQGQRHRFRWAATCVQSDGPQSGLGADSGGFQNGSTAQDGLPSVFNQVDGHQSGFGRAPERGRSFRWAATCVRSTQQTHVVRKRLCAAMCSKAEQGALGAQPLQTNGTFTWNFQTLEE